MKFQTDLFIRIYKSFFYIKILPHLGETTMNAMKNLIIMFFDILLKRKNLENILNVELDQGNLPLSVAC